MENSSTEYGSSSSHLWWLDNSHNRCHQSQWLQFTLSEFEKKVKKMLSLIEEDGDSFAERAEVFYKKRPSIIASAEDLHGSYRSLAEKYNQLVSGYENGSDHDHDAGLDFERWLSLESRTELKKMKHGVLRFDDDFEIGWNKLRLTLMKLVQDSLEQKVELVKRNNDNREAINDLRAYIRKLLVQNIELKSKLAQTKGDIKRNESQLSRAEDVILKEILP
ncbi:protein NETWORKED 3A-like isoform X2 [Cynara cardunculus var. scolymus]|uniref:protein NETWORKED 3A-like isoform X2 n=1 Tax=Cynara cardunculus var. scolymus TaxID=59895 RepID=UPI000D62A3DE|nr:protein NETWORKED 3A-like isoform X2 [Cynara cardunculus var. scolymus]